MNCTILLHSTTGNTRLVTKYAAARLEKRGVTVRIHDIVRHPEMPDLSDCDLLGVSCPTMYFRGTLAMEYFLDRLPAASPAPKPAFLLATASGQTGAHFPIQAEQLRPNGWVTMGARFVPCVDNWPIARTLTRPARPFLALGALANRWLPPLSELLGFLWPELGDPEKVHREQVKVFVDEMVRRASSGTPLDSFRPLGMTVQTPILGKIGRMMTADKMASSTRVRIVPKACSRCGVCVNVCPVGCIWRDDADDVPQVGTGCTGCWACFNHCPEGAISGLAAPRGSGRYPGPSREMRSLFHTK